MKIFLFLLCFWLASQGSKALEWNQSVKKSGSTIYACSNGTVIFPYLFNLSESESIVSMTWTYHGNDVTRVIGNLLTNEFMTTRNYFDKVILSKNGNFTMLNANMKDTGNYILKIQTQMKDQSKPTYAKEFWLVVSENVMYKGNKLIAKLSDKADWNSDTESFSLSLTCGDFIFKNNNAPIDVEWITPDGSLKNSTMYSDGKFYLQLDNPVKGGQYVCNIPKRLLSTVCATSNDNTQVSVSFNEDKAEIILLKNDIKKIKEEFEEGNTKLKKQFEKGDTKLKKQLEDENTKFKKQLEDKNTKLKKQFEDENTKLKKQFEDENTKLKKQFEDEITKLKKQFEDENTKLEKQFEKIREQYKKLKENDEKLIKKSGIAKSCEDWNFIGSGKKKISLINSSSIQLYCDQDTDGGRWNVFQRRRDGSEDFYRGWSDYRNGFGDPDKEFWLGLETLHQMTNNGRKYELRFDLEKQDGLKYYAVYDDFSIGSESEGYAVHFTGYQGNAGDSFTWHKDMKFTTNDRDQDAWPYNCAVRRHGAWWYTNCGGTNLNGRYNKTDSDGVVWYKITYFDESLKKTEMKFRIKK